MMEYNDSVSSTGPYDEEGPASDLQKGAITANDKPPALLRAIDLILAEPAEIAREAETLHERFRAKHGDERNDDEIADMTANKIISNYSYFTAFAGGATALTGVVPGLGTATAVFGGALADTALSMKFQIEMTMAIAAVYGHDITTEEQKRLCFLIAGLGTINHAAKDGGKAVGAKAFTRLVQQHLRGSTLIAVKEVFKRVGIRFTRTAFEKAIPFGVGVVIGAGTGKALTWYVGNKARDFFRIQ
ncbi:MAG: hypothetical protein OXJ55_06125 [Caldilineaceae bacterium]|nr:hypothetical protein [Caldilineaceae bacterium]